MFDFFKNLRERWDNWCGDRDMEIAIRKHLSLNGYYGRSAKLKRVRLVAIERPGWLQVYRFEVSARVALDEELEGVATVEAEYHDLYGLVKDDLRHKISVVRVFKCEKERRELFARWSENLVCLRGAHGLSS